MNLTTALYLTDLLSNIDTIFSILFFMGVILFIISFIGKVICADQYMDDESTYDKLWTTILKKWWVLALICLPPAITPAKSTMYLMMAASYLQESNLPTKVSKTLELKLDKYIDELTQGAKKDD